MKIFCHNCLYLFLKTESSINLKQNKKGYCYQKKNVDFFKN